MPLDLAKVTECHTHLPEMKVEIKNLCKMPLNRGFVDWILVFSYECFKNQHFLDDTLDYLHASVFELTYFKALIYLSTHLVKNESVLDLPRSNMITEWACS